MITVGIIGTGQIGYDLLLKLLKLNCVKLFLLVRNLFYELRPNFPGFDKFREGTDIWVWHRKESSKNLSKHFYILKTIIF